jgi:hypothetical protein
MARKKRGFSTFSLSFLDIMSCGLGAVALVFLIMKHDVDTKGDIDNPQLLSEVKLLQEDIVDGEVQLVRAKNTVSELDQQLVDAQGLARRINESIDAVRNKIAVLDDPSTDQQILQLEAKLQELETTKKKLEEEERERGNDVRRYLGQGERQYLTGLKLGGARILILVDVSSSMLDETIVNIIRRRNMRDDIKVQAPKWQQTLKTVDWLTARFPQESNYQIYTFSDTYQSVIPGSEGDWLQIGDKAELELSILNLRKTIPNGGTNLQQVLAAVNSFDQVPDNVYLITDGLPTLGEKAPRSGTITGREREKLFFEAVEDLPFGVPVNIVLLPLEGDPMAAAAYWELAQTTRGSFIAPSRDWP